MIKVVYTHTHIHTTMSCPKFCPNCYNYLYLQTSQVASSQLQGSTKTKPQLEKICHNCGFVEKCTSFFETSSTQKKVDTTDLKYDLTLMRTRAVKCPKKCNGEVLYLKKKAQEQFLLFVCCDCSTQFKHGTVAAAASGADDDDGGEDEDDGGEDEDEDDEGAGAGDDDEDDDDGADEDGADDIADEEYDMDQGED